MSITLRIIHGGEERFHEIRDHESVVLIGRHTTCDVVLDEEKRASRKHCQIERQSDGRFLLRDLDSANGTVLNRAAVAGAMPLSPGDRVRIGETTIYFGEPPVPAAAPAAPAAPAAVRPAANVDRDMRRAEAVLARSGGGGPAAKLAVAAIGVFVVGLAVVLYLAQQQPAVAPPSPERGASLAQDGANTPRGAGGGGGTADDLGRTDPGHLAVPDFAALRAEQERHAEALRRAAGIEASRDPLAQRVAAYDALLLEYRDSGVYPVLAEKQAVFLQGLGRMLDRLAEQRVAEVDALRRHFRFAAALRRLFEARAELAAVGVELAAVSERFETRWQAILQQSLQTVNAQAEQIYVHQVDRDGVALIEQAQALLVADQREAAAEKIGEAETHYREALETYFVDHSAAPTRTIETVASQIDMQLHDLADLRDVIRRGDEAQAAAVARRMAQRHAEEREAGPTEGLGDARPARRPDPLADREPELLAALHQRLIDACNQEDGFDLRERRTRFHGRDAWIDSATPEHINVRLAGQSGREAYAWSRLQPEMKLALYQTIKPRDAEAAFGIAIYAFDHGQQTTAERVLHDLLQASPALQDAIDVFLSRRRDIDIPSEGFVAFEGRVVTPDERDAVLVARKIEDLIKRLEGIDSSSRRRQEEAQQAIGELQQHSAVVRRHAVHILLEKKEAQQARLATYGFGSNAHLDELKARLDEAREAALKLIYDEQAYPYPNPNKLGQAEVDVAVGKVRQIWEDPSAVVTERVDPRVGQMVDRITFFLAMARQLDPGSEILSGQEEQEFLDWVRSLVNQRLSIQNYSPHAGERQLYALHTQVDIDNMYGDSDATSEERQHVRIVNNYRRMMGRGPLRINSDLTRASRAHSQYMQASGQFAHNIPGHPDGASPGDRARKFGYSGGVGENIAMNGRGHTPHSSFAAWYNSSGHHRNMLRREWVVMGVGSVGTHWTQMFGGQTNGSEPVAEGTHEPLPTLPVGVGTLSTSGR